MAATDLCSLADVRARTTTGLTDTALGALITAVSDGIESYVGAWLAPRADTTLLFDCERTGSSLKMQQGDLRCGVRAITALGLATSSQPETGGLYANATLSNVLMRPRPTPDTPASTLVLISGYFSRGFNVAQAAGSFGPAAVSARAKEAAIELVLLRLSHTPGTSSESVGDWSISSSDWAEAEASILSTIPQVMSL